ncbi:hypothetical protein Hanom_Chr09g00785771 [Helianthus anomalus]
MYKCFVYVNVNYVSIVFRIDCIFRAFTAKGEMQCANCRDVEMSRWPLSNSPRPSNELNVDGLVNRGDVMSQSIFPHYKNNILLAATPLSATGQTSPLLVDLRGRC